MFLLGDLRFVLCSRDLDIPRAQRIVGFNYPQINEVGKITWIETKYQMVWLPYSGAMKCMFLRSSRLVFTWLWIVSGATVVTKIVRTEKPKYTDYITCELRSWQKSFIVWKLANCDAVKCQVLVQCSMHCSALQWISLFTLSNVW